MRNLSNYEIVKIAEGMPGGLQGFCKTWGWVQFGRALLAAAAATPPDQDRPDAIAKWGTPPAAEGGIKWQCGPQASGFTAPPKTALAWCWCTANPTPLWTSACACSPRAMRVARVMPESIPCGPLIDNFPPRPEPAIWHEGGGFYNIYQLELFANATHALRASHGQAPAQAGRAYKNRTPELHVGDSAFESWYSTYNPAHKSDKQRASDAFAAGVEWEANRRRAETPFAWAEFDGEGGYYLCLYEDNEGYRDEFLKRNPNPIYKTWVFPLVKQK